MYSGEICNRDFRIKQNGKIVCYGTVLESGKLAKIFHSVHHTVPVEHLDHVITCLEKAQYDEYGTISGAE